LVGLDSNREDTGFEHSLHLVNITAGGVLVGGALNILMGLAVVITSRVNTDIWVIRPEDLLVSLKVIAGVGYVTTIATIAGSDTINELLSGEFFEGTVELNAVVGRHGSLGREGPA